jgi:hypothetical protein
MADKSAMGTINRPLQWVRAVRSMASSVPTVVRIILSMCIIGPYIFLRSFVPVKMGSGRLPLDCVFKFDWDSRVVGKGPPAV